MLDHPTLLVAHTGLSRPSESLAVRIFDTLFSWIERTQSRRALASLTDAQLSDIGLTRAEANFEADKGFWRQ